MLYAAPGTAARVLQINPVTDDVKEIGPSILGAQKYQCIAAASDGLLYSVPGSARRVLRIDPMTEKVAELGPLLQGTSKYMCLAAAPYGLLYAVPRDAPSVLQIAEAEDQLPSLYNASLLEDGKYSDVSIVVGSHSFAAHRAILARVPFFRASFDREFAERSRGVIEIRGTSARVFRYVLEVIYTGNMQFIQEATEVELLEELLEVAERFQLSRMRVQVAKKFTELLDGHMGLTVETVGRYFSFARLFALPSITRLCLKYTKEHGADVLLAPETNALYSSDYDTFVDLVCIATGKRPHHGPHGSERPRS